MKQLKHRQNVLAHRIEGIEEDMLSITKETFEELDYLKKELCKGCKTGFSSNYANCSFLYNLLFAF